MVQGRSLAYKAFTFIWHHKKLLCFPLLAVLSSLSTAALWGTLFYHRHQHEIDAIITRNNEDYPSGLFLFKCLLFIVLIKFTSTLLFGFANIGLSYTTTQIFRNYPVSLCPGILRSIQCLFPNRLLTWALIDIVESPHCYASTGSLLFRSIEDRWSTATFLALPLMAHEHMAARASIRKSAALMEKTFGNQLVNTVQRMYAILTWTVLVLLFLMIIGTSYLTSFTSAYVSPTKLIIMFIGSVFVIIVTASVVASATMTVLRTAVYHYTMGSSLIGPFTTQELQSSFVSYPSSNRNP